MARPSSLLACISLYPFFWMIYMSLHDVELGSAVWNNFENFTKLATDSRYLNGWVLLFQYSALCLLLQIGIGVFLAVALNGARYEKFLVTAFLMPMMMAPIVAGLVWYFLYNGTFGWYHWLFQSLGILGAKSILASPNTAMYGLVIVDVWQWTPLITLITFAGLKRVPQDQLEPARAELELAHTLGEDADGEVVERDGDQLVRGGDREPPRSSSLRARRRVRQLCGEGKATLLTSSTSTTCSEGSVRRVFGPALPAPAARVSPSPRIVTRPCGVDW